MQSLAKSPNLGYYSPTSRPPLSTHSLYAPSTLLSDPSLYIRNLPRRSPHSHCPRLIQLYSTAQLSPGQYNSVIIPPHGHRNRIQPRRRDNPQSLMLFLLGPVLIDLFLPTTHRRPDFPPSSPTTAHCTYPPALNCRSQSPTIHPYPTISRACLTTAAPEERTSY